MVSVTRRPDWQRAESAAAASTSFRWWTGSLDQGSPSLAAPGGQNSVLNRSKQCAIVYTRMATSIHENQPILSSAWTNLAPRLRRAVRVASIEFAHFPGKA